MSTNGDRKRDEEKKLKVKQSHYTTCRRRVDKRYSSYSFMTSALDEGAWSASRPDRVLSPGKGPPVPIEEKGGKIVVQAIT
jgi:hypothetical protein